MSEVLVRYEPTNDNYSTEINLNLIPINALRSHTRHVLSVLLNSKKILPSEEGYHRDWRGLRYLVGLDNNHENLLSTEADPTSRILTKWSNDDITSANFFNLQDILGKIDRWDIVDDTRELLIEDATNYLVTKRQGTSLSIVEKQNQSVYNPSMENDDILTTDDLVSAKYEIQQLHYDAFVLFADEDIDFAIDLIRKVEEMGFKLCAKDRDLVSADFEHEAIIQLISKRCSRLIIIVSPHFLKSSVNKFFVNYAQALGIEEDRNKIIPVLYERCPIPTTLRFYFLLDYARSGYLYNFWDKLKESLEKGSLSHKKVILPSSQTDNREIVRRKNLAQEAIKTKEKAIIEEINSSVQIHNNNKQEKEINKQNNNIISISSNKIKSTSMWNINSSTNQKMKILDKKIKDDDENNIKTKSNISLNEITTPTKKKTKWLKNFLTSKSSSSSKSSTDILTDKKVKTKKKLFQKKIVAEC